MTLDITPSLYNGTFDITSLGVGPNEEKVSWYNVTSSFLAKKNRIQKQKGTQQIIKKLNFKLACKSQHEIM